VFTHKLTLLSYEQLNFLLHSISTPEIVHTASENQEQKIFQHDLITSCPLQIQCSLSSQTGSGQVPGESSYEQS